jgi:hypothetical protein
MTNTRYSKALLLSSVVLVALLGAACTGGPAPIPAGEMAPGTSGTGGSHKALDIRVAAGGLGGTFGSAAVSLDDISGFQAASGSFTKVPYTTKLYDPKNAYDLASHSFTAPIRWDYQVCASLASFGADFEIDVFVNDRRAYALAASVGGVAQACRPVTVWTGDLIDVRVYQGTGAAMSFSSNTYWNWLTIYMTDQKLSVDGNNAFQVLSGSFTPVPYANEIYDGDRVFDPSTHRLTNTNVGIYETHLCASVASFAQDFELDLFVGGARERAFAIGRHGAGSGCRTVRIPPGSTLDVRVYQGSGSPMSVPSNVLWSWLTTENRTAYVSLGDVAGFVVPDRTFTTVPYSNVLYDIGSEYDPQTGRFKPQSAGDYEFCASLASFVQGFELDLFINGNRENAFAMSNYGAGIGCRTIRLRGGDAVDVRVWQQTGKAMSFAPNTLWNWLTISRWSQT